MADIITREPIMAADLATRLGEIAEGAVLSEMSWPEIGEQILSAIPETGAMERALSLIADERSWAGFSPMPTIERMRATASAALKDNTHAG